MQTHDFFGQVQHHARLPDLDQAMRATRATLEALAQRIGSREAKDLASQLPPEVGRFLHGADTADGESFSSDEFLNRVSRGEGVDLPVSVHHARAVLEVLQDAVAAGETADVLARLPNVYRRLFGGAEGRMRSV